MTLRSSLARSTRRAFHGIARGVFRKADDTKKQQLVDVDLLEEESKAAVEHWLPYGFTAVPQDGAEAVVVFPGGNRSHGIVVAVADRRYRLTGLANGEVALHDDQGQKAHFKREGVDVHSTRPRIHLARGKERVVMRENFVQLKVSPSDDPDQAGAAPMHFTLDFEAQVFKKSPQPIVEAEDPNPQD